MSGRFLVPVSSIIALALLMPALANAQSTTPANPTADSRAWVVVGGASTSILGDCTTCENQGYGHTGSVLVNAGVSLSRRTDVGAEVLWVPSHIQSGEALRVTFLMASVQFRPWQASGFFLKAGVGTAFVRNWVVNLEGTGEAPPFTSTAFGLGLGAGWEWRTRGPIGVQILGTQHVAALGDLNTGTSTVDNVIGNFWSVGAAVVIR